jgi:hypothetical protein
MSVRPNCSRLLYFFSQSFQFCQTRVRIPSTTLAGAFARNCSFPSCRWPFAISFSSFPTLLSGARARRPRRSSFHRRRGHRTAPCCGRQQVSPTNSPQTLHLLAWPAARPRLRFCSISDESPLLRENFDRHFHLLLDFQFRPQIADADDQVLQDRHAGLSRQINLLLIRLRISRQRNRLQRRLAVVNRVPDFFRDERHHRMQQPQRCSNRLTRLAQAMRAPPRRFRN